MPGGGEEVPKVDLRGLTGHHGHQCLLLGQEVHGGRLRQLTQVLFEAIRCVQVVELTKCWVLVASSVVCQVARPGKDPGYAVEVPALVLLVLVLVVVVDEVAGVVLVVVRVVHVLDPQPVLCSHLSVLARLCYPLSPRRQKLALLQDKVP